jgi:rubrerythrin
MLQKIDNNIIIEQHIDSFTICADPGCDGYNTESVAIFEEILKKNTDFILILGDIVPTGSPKFFNQFKNIVNTSARSKVFCLPGNHDIKNYDTFIGKKNYYIKAPNALIIMLDNSERKFTDKTLHFLKTTLNEIVSKNIFICLHIPPKNPYVDNKISDTEWNKIKNILEAHKEKIKNIFTGHIHSHIDYKHGEYPISVTGGAGAKLDKIDNLYQKSNYHAIKMIYKNNIWTKEIQHIECSTEDLHDPILKKYLLNSSAGENNACNKYQLFAKQAENEGFTGISKLFKAISNSEFVHTENMFTALNKMGGTANNLMEAINSENNEIKNLYPRYLKYSKEIKNNKAENAYCFALETEKIHSKLLSEALKSLADRKDIPELKYTICTRCGYMNRSEKIPQTCPICGTDKFKFIEL